MLGKIAGRPAAIVTFLDGLWIRRPSPGHCAAVGRRTGAAASCRRAISSRSARTRLSIESWRPLYEHAKPRGDSVRQGLCSEIATELDALEKSWPRQLAARRDPRRPFPGQRLLPRRQVVRPDRFLFCLHRYARLRRRDLPQRLVLRGRPFLQRHQGALAAQRLRQGASAFASASGRAARSRARCGHALPAHAAGRLAGGTGRRAGEAERSAGILSQAALSPVGENVQDYGSTDLR